MASNVLIPPKLEKTSELIDERQNDPELQALRAKLIAVLEKSDLDDELKTSRKNAASKSVTIIHITSPLFSTLRSCLQQLNYLSCAHILKYLVKNMQCNMDLVLQLMTAILEKDSSHPFQLSNFLSTFSNLKNISRDEVRLLHVIYYLNFGQFNEALSVASKMEDFQWSRFKRSTIAPEVAFNLLSGYKMLLRYMESKSTEPDAEGCYLESFQALVTENSFLPLFAETYTKILLDSSQPQEAESFIRKFVETESKNSGLLAPLQALNIVKLHMSAHHKLAFDLLQSIADKDPSHPLVLELCWKYLRNNVPRRDHAQPSSDSDMESDGNSEQTTTKSLPENLKKCLNLVFNFLDSNFNNCQAWNILHENLRNICLSGAKECAGAVVSCWHHSGRRSWWLDECFGLQSVETQQDTPAALLTNKAISCFILEDASHPYVQYVLSTSKSNQLKIIMKQLDKAKHRFDKLMKPFLIRTTASDPVLNEQPAVSKTEVRIRKLFLKYLQSSKINMETQAEIVRELTGNQIAGEIHPTPIKKYDENFYWDLPVYERFKSRIMKREEDRKTRNAKKERKKIGRNEVSESQSSSSSSSETDSEDELIDQLIHGKKEKSDAPKGHEALFLEPASRIESSSPLPSASYPCPTPDLQFTSTPAPKETIRIEERYQFFNRDSGSSSGTETSDDLKAADCDAERNFSVRIDAEDELSEEKSTKKSAQFSSVCTSLSLRLEASSPDIFQSENDNHSYEDSPQMSPSVPRIPQLTPENLPPTSMVDLKENKKIKKNKNKNKKKQQQQQQRQRNRNAIQKSLTEICFEVLDAAIENHSLSATNIRVDKAASSKPNGKSQGDPENRDALIAELLGSEKLVKSDPNCQQKVKTKKRRKKAEKKRKRKKRSREDMIAELLGMTNKTLQCNLSESAASTKQPCKVTADAPKYKPITELNASDEREVIIAELLSSNRKSLAESTCIPDRKARSAEEKEYIPTDAEELKIQMAIHRKISKAVSDSSSSVESGHFLSETDEVIPQDIQTKLVDLNDHFIEQPSSKQRVEMWLNDVLIQIAEDEKTFKRPRTGKDRSPKEHLQSPKGKRLKTSHSITRKPVNHPVLLTSIHPISQPTSSKAIQSSACSFDPNPVKRKKLFSQVANFLNVSYRSRKN